MLLLAARDAITCSLERLTCHAFTSWHGHWRWRSSPRSLRRRLFADVAAALADMAIAAVAVATVSIPEA